MMLNELEQTMAFLDRETDMFKAACELATSFGFSFENDAFQFPTGWPIHEFVMRKDLNRKKMGTYVVDILRSYLLDLIDDGAMTPVDYKRISRGDGLRNSRSTTELFAKKKQMEQMGWHSEPMPHKSRRSSKAKAACNGKDKHREGSSVGKGKKTNKKGHQQRKRERKKEKGTKAAKRVKVANKL